MDALLRALEALRAKYQAEFDQFKKAADEGELPLWMSTTDCRTTMAMMIAKKAVVEDLQKELEGATASIVVAESAVRETVADIQNAVCSYYGIERGLMLGAGRSHIATHPRMVAMYLCRNRLGLSYPELGTAFHRDHTTVINAVRSVQNWIEQGGHDLLHAVETIEQNLEQREK